MNGVNGLAVQRLIIQEGSFFAVISSTVTVSLEVRLTGASRIRVLVPHCMFLMVSQPVLIMSRAVSIAHSVM